MPKIKIGWPEVDITPKEKISLAGQFFERGSHYSAYVSSGFTGHEGGDLLVREALQNINEMFRK